MRGKPEEQQLTESNVFQSLLGPAVLLFEMGYSLSPGKALHVQIVPRELFSQICCDT